MQTDDGRDVRLPGDYLAHAEHGYAMTGHVSQGDRRSDLPARDARARRREWAYVAGSRQRMTSGLRVHHEPDGEDALERAWSRSQAKRSRSTWWIRLGRRGDGGRARRLMATPERLIARAEELRAAREQVRAELSMARPNGELARVAEQRDGRGAG